MQVKEEKRHLNFYEYFLVFFVACFLGVGLEMIYWYIRTGVIESRSGLIYGPFNLVYGIGALLMTIVLLNQKNKVKVFVLGFLIGAIFEFSCSVFQEYVFHTVSWDYGNSFLSLGGRVNLFFSCCWGILAVVWVELVIPLLLKIFAKINFSTKKAVTIVLLIFMIFNVTVSFMACYRQRLRKDGVPARNQLEVFLDKMYPDEMLDKIYANKKYVR